MRCQRRATAFCAWGMRVVVPSKLRNQVVSELHRRHPGIVRMKALARSYMCGGLTLTTKLKRVHAKSCSSCQANKHAPAKAPLHPWNWPIAPWEWVHIDFTGPVSEKMLLALTDVHSKWPEVAVMDSTTSTKTITVLREIFARFGLPRQVVSDNGSQFTSS